MEITRVDVTPVELSLRLPYRTAHTTVERVGAVFIRLETRREKCVGWGCAAFEPSISGETLAKVTQVCQACADIARDLPPLNTEYALAQLAGLTSDTPSARCAFDMAFHDLLGAAADLPLHRLLGGYRYKIQTSVTINLSDVKETVEQAQERAAHGFRRFTIKGGLDPDEVVRRVEAIHAALPGFTLRLDADQGYTVQQALDVTRALEGQIEFLEQPTPAADLDMLCEVTRNSSVPILADESLMGPESALEIASRGAAHGMSTKLATCGGLTCARQIDAIGRAAHLATMVGCINEPALLIAAGLGLALSSPNVRYADLDGHLDLLNDPSRPSFRIEEGWLIAADSPGLGCSVEM